MERWLVRGGGSAAVGTLAAVILAVPFSMATAVGVGAVVALATLWRLGWGPYFAVTATLYYVGAGFAVLAIPRLTEAHGHAPGFVLLGFAVISGILAVVYAAIDSILSTLRDPADGASALVSAVARLVGAVVLVWIAVRSKERIARTGSLLAAIPGTYLITIAFGALDVPVLTDVAGFASFTLFAGLVAAGFHTAGSWYKVAQIRHDPTAQAAAAGTKRAAGTAKEGTKQAAGTAKEGTKQAAGTAKEGTKRAAGTAKEGTKQAAGTAKEGTKRAAETARSGTTEAARVAKTGTERATETARNAPGTAREATGELTRGAGERIDSLPTEREAVTERAGETRERIADRATGISDRLSGVTAGVTDRLGSGDDDSGGDPNSDRAGPSEGDGYETRSTRESRSEPGPDRGQTAFDGDSNPFESEETSCEED